MERYFKAKLISVSEICGETYEVRLKVEDDFDFKVGQYIWLLMPRLLYDDPRGDRRAFSISSSPLEKNYISVIFRKGLSGYKRTLTELPKGTDLTIIGPFGSAFAVSENENIPVVMIAGGVGVAPFLSVTRYFSWSHVRREINLVCLNPSADGTVYLTELQDMTKLNENFRFRSLYERFRWEHIQDLVLDKDKTTFYIAGPQGMINFVYDVLKKSGISDNKMVFEQFHPNVNNEIKSLLAIELGKK